MMCERTLFVGTTLALLLLSGIARSADESAPAPSRPTEEVDGIKRRPAVEITDDTAASWRRSRSKPAGGIRFIKPSIPGADHAAASARALATDGGPSVQTIESLHQQRSAAPQDVSVKRSQNNTRVPVGISPAQVPTDVAPTVKTRQPGTDDQLAGATAAKLQQLIEQPEPQTNAAVQRSNRKADCDVAIAVCATNAPTYAAGPPHVSITDGNQFSTDHGNDQTPSNSASDSVNQPWAQDAGRQPHLLRAAGSRLLHGIGQLFPKTESRPAVAQ